MGQPKTDMGRTENCPYGLGRIGWDTAEEGDCCSAVPGTLVDHSLGLGTAYYYSAAVTDMNFDTAGWVDKAAFAAGLLD